MSIERQTIAAVKWAALGRVASQGVTWAISIVVMRLLMPADYGLMALVAVVTTIAAAIGEAGVNSSIIQARDLDDRLLRKLAGLTFAVYALLFALVLLGAPLLAAYFNDERVTPLLQVASLQFLLTAASAVPQSLAARELRFKLLAAVELAASVAAALITLAAAWTGLGVWALIAGALGGALVRSALLLWRGRFVMPSFDLRGTGELLGFGSKLALASVLWSVIVQSDALVGGHYLSAAELGIYAVALHLATLPMQKLMSVINQVAFSAVARLQAEQERLRERLLLAQRLLASLSVPTLWGLAAVAPELISVLLGAKWSAAVAALQLASVVVPLRAASMLMMTAVMGVGRADVMLRSTFTAAVVWPLCFAVGAQWGAAGLAAAWLVALPISFGVNFPRICGALGIDARQIGRAVWKALLAGLLMVAAVTLARQPLLGLHELLRLVLLVATGAAVYVGALHLLDRSLIPTLWQIARPRPA